ncbi:hypothetical protein [Deinococcus pimensis]|uniref:hypothetical protein n=1 Tax=Deinococcus pimensis TaxID=309888 RepID=UPI000480CE28|nr:hypothetical protein [Deinococcus pimensis]
MPSRLLRGLLIANVVVLVCFAPLAALALITPAGLAFELLSPGGSWSGRQAFLWALSSVGSVVYVVGWAAVVGLWRGRTWAPPVYRAAVLGYLLVVPLLFVTVWVDASLAPYVVFALPAALFVWTAVVEAREMRERART